MQQLREGVPNFFAVFIEVLRKGGVQVEVEPGVTCGDYLNGFLIGTRRALHENGRESITLTVPRVNGATLGELIALFERAVGLYASLVNINAYHQPGVEAGKKAAAAVLKLQEGLVAAMKSSADALDPRGWAERIGQPGEAETAYLVLRHLAHNSRHVKTEGLGPTAKFRWEA